MAPSRDPFSFSMKIKGNALRCSGWLAGNVMVLAATNTGDGKVDESEMIRI